MIRKPKSTVLKVLFSGILFASLLFVTSCNNEKKQTEEATKTDSITPAPAPAPSTTDTTQAGDTAKPGPVTPVN